MQSSGSDREMCPAQRGSSRLARLGFSWPARLGFSRPARLGFSSPARLGLAQQPRLHAIENLPPVSIPVPRSPPTPSPPPAMAVVLPSPVRPPMQRHLEPRSVPGPTHAHAGSSDPARSMVSYTPNPPPPLRVGCRLRRPSHRGRPHRLGRLCRWSPVIPVHRVRRRSIPRSTDAPAC
jgi:hypothetical protein